MDMTQMISFIIPVRDRSRQRIKNCVKSLASDITGEIIIIDYGSKKPVSGVSGARIIRYDKNKIWNKAHDINLGIKKSKYKYIGTVDCDMILPKDFIESVKLHLNDTSFIYSINVKRIYPKHVCSDFKTMLKNSTPWFENESRRNIIHNANGGIQIYSKEWIVSVCGVDESLIYWGAIDNDVFERAIMCGMAMVNINKPILHQEHKLKKEKNLPESERLDAFRIRIEKVKYLDEMFKSKKYIRNNGRWGTQTANQNRFIKNKVKIERRKEMIIKKRNDYTERFINATKLGKKSFIFNGKKIDIFK